MLKRKSFVMTVMIVAVLGLLGGTSQAGVVIEHVGDNNPTVEDPGWVYQWGGPPEAKAGSLGGEAGWVLEAGEGHGVYAPDIFTNNPGLLTNGWILDVRMAFLSQPTGNNDVTLLVQDGMHSAGTFFEGVNWNVAPSAPEVPQVLTAHPGVGVWGDYRIEFDPAGNGGDGSFAFSLDGNLIQTRGRSELETNSANRVRWSHGASNSTIWSLVRLCEGDCGPVEEVTEFTWVQDGVGDWNSTDNWNPRGTPGHPNHTVVFGEMISGPTTVVTNDPVTVNRIELNNATNTYVVAGFGSLNLTASTKTPPVDPFISVHGSHEFQLRVNLDGDATVDVATDSTLVFNNALNLMGQTLTKTGVGTLEINNLLTAGGGTLVGLEGTISGSGTVGGDLNNQSGTISPGNSQALAASTRNGTGPTFEGELIGFRVASIPEPSSLLLGVLGVVGLLVRRGRRPDRS